MQYDGLQRQLEMFLTGMMGEVPEIPAGSDALRERAQAAMTPQAYGYVAGSAGNERTAKANVRAFDAYPIVPRLLRNVESRDLSTTVLGEPWPAPVALAPIGVLGIVHEEGEKAVARAASKVGVPFVLSTVSSFDIETVAAEAGEGRRWFQLYWPKSRELALSLVKRAEAAGYSALVVTLDTYLLAWRPRDLENGYVPFVYGDGLANYVSDPVFRAGLGEDPADNPTQTVLYFASIFSNAGLTWDDLAWLREQTDLPILLKGLLHPDDAQAGIDRGADGIIVSNHGGRQMDGAIAALDALPAIVERVGHRCEVLFDSGIRTGSDVMKALSLGAKAVLLGRPYVYGLGIAGESGVRDVALNLLADLDLSLGLAGLKRMSELGPELFRNSL